VPCSSAVARVCCYASAACTPSPPPSTPGSAAGGGSSYTAASSARLRAYGESNFLSLFLAACVLNTCARIRVHPTVLRLYTVSICGNGLLLVGLVG